MGLNLAAIAIKGDFTNRISEIASILNYFDDEDFPQELKQQTFFKKGWTMILDKEIVLVTEDDLLSELSDVLKTEIYGFILQSVSDTTAFFRFKEGEDRLVMLQEGDLVMDEGEPITLEAEINIEELTEENVLELAEKAGIDLLNLMD